MGAETAGNGRIAAVREESVSRYEPNGDLLGTTSGCYE